MKLTIKGTPGLPSMRYLRTDYDRERLLKVFETFGRGVFTIRNLKSDVLPDTTSGEITRWDSNRVIECVGRTPQTKKESSVKIWKLSDTVARVMNQHLIGG